MKKEPLSAKAVFDHALEIDSPSDREAYLDQACAGDDGLRQKVVALLEAYQRAGNFLEVDPTRVDGIGHGVTECPGAVIGPYKLLQQLGEGGMGTVFMAEQTHPVKRTVAIKVIKQGMDTRQVIARFEAERQALAMMNHQNIARILDAGTTDTGRPYFVMDLVKGVPITDYCDLQHLSVRERLELMSAVCQAVQHAHQKGIIHRDIKPTNVLVAEYDGKPVPKVIDFGVAKATSQRLTEKTMFTELGQLVGTVEYMSPEQARLNQLDVDTRSDIYSLGVLLYELLTGSTPFARKRLQEAAFDEMLRIIREEEPPKPSMRLSTSEGLPSIAANRGLEPLKLNRLLRGELDWVTMKALEKDRNRRYETASAFVADLEHYLRDEAVQACPPSAAYRFRKFARRNMAALTMVFVVALAALLLVGSIGWMLRDRGARAREFARDRATQQAAIEREVDLALKEVERSQGKGEWTEALSAVERAQGLLAGGGSDRVRERVHQSQTELDMILRLEEFRTRRGSEYDHASLNAAYTGLFADFGIDVESVTPQEIAARIARRPATAVRFAAALDDWAMILRDWGLHDRTRDPAVWKRLLEAARLADPDPWRSELRQLSGQEDLTALRKLADESDMTVLPVQSLQQMGNALIFGGDGPACVGWLRKAHRQYPGDDLISIDLAFHLSHLPSADWVEVLRFAEAALAARPSPFIYDYVGNILKKIRRDEEAIACYLQAIEFDPKYALAYTDLSNALRDQGKLDEAIAVNRRLVSMEKETASATPGLKTKARTYEVWLAFLLRDRAWQLVAGDDPNSYDPGRAIELAQEAGVLLPDWGHLLRVLGVAHYRAGNWTAAVEALEESRRQHYAKDSVILFYLSMAHERLNETEQAQMFYDEAVQWRMGILLTEEELRRLCAEAAGLLSLEVPPTLSEPPATTPGPTLLKTAANATVDNGFLDGDKLMVWDFDWSDVPGATHYHLYVTGRTEESWIINDPTLTSSLFRLEMDSQDLVGAHWKVRALVNETWSEWSDGQNITVAPLDNNKPASLKK